MMKTVAVIGAGALGKIFVRNFSRILTGRYALLGILARTRPDALAEEAGCAAYADLSELLAEHPDFVVELAGQAAVKAYGEKVLLNGSDLILVSAGALADPSLGRSLTAAAQETGRRIHIASGAIGGFDIMRTFDLMGEVRASIENIKPPEALEGAPYLNGRNIPRDGATTIFQGSVQSAIEGFPKNVNVAVALEAAVKGNTQVTIQSVPGLPYNRHIIRLHAPTAQAEISVTSAPDPENPKSSTMTAWSVLALLDNLASPVQFF